MPGQTRSQNLADALFMGWVGVGVDQADGHRRDVLREQFAPDRLDL